MNQCACGCGTEVKKTWARGHQFRKKDHAETIKAALEVGAALLTLTVKPPETVITEGPPEYPHPIDRSRWRLAEDRPGTPQTNPWIRTQCHSCLLPMWTKDPLSIWEKGGTCEECSYLFREDLGAQVAKRNGAMRTPYDPFI